MSRKTKIKRIDNLTNRILDRQMYVRTIPIGVCNLINIYPDEKCKFCTDGVHCFYSKSCKSCKAFVSN